MSETTANKGLGTTLKSLEEKKREVELREGGGAKDELKMLAEAKADALTKADVEAEVGKEKHSLGKIITAKEIPGTSPAPSKAEALPMPLLPGDGMQRGG